MRSAVTHWIDYGRHSLLIKNSLNSEYYSAPSYIQDILRDQTSLFSVCHELESMAKRYVNLAIQSEKQRDEIDSITADYREVDLNSLETIRLRTVAHSGGISTALP